MAERVKRAPLPEPKFKVGDTVTIWRGNTPLIRSIVVVANKRGIKLADGSSYPSDGRIVGQWRGQGVDSGQRLLVTTDQRSEALALLAEMDWTKIATDQLEGALAAVNVRLCPEPMVLGTKERV